MSHVGSAFVATGRRDVTIQWISGALFVMGLLGSLRQLGKGGFFSAPGVSIAGAKATPFVYMVVLILGVVGLVALKSERVAGRYLSITAAITGALAVVGAFAGEDADGLAMNTRMVLFCGVLAVAAGIVWFLERPRGGTT